MTTRDLLLLLHIARIRGAAPRIRDKKEKEEAPRIPIIITNVYQLHYTNYKSLIGLGDFIKGSLYLMGLCDKHGYKVQIDISNHPMGKYFVLPTDFIKPDYRKITMWSFADNCIPSLKVSSYYTCCRKSHLPKDIKQEHLEYMKNALTPTVELLQNVDNILAKYSLNKKGYDIIHIRMGDNYLFSHGKVNIAVLIERKICKMVNMSKHYIILSDNAHIKQHLKKYDNFHTEESSTIVHLGRANEDDNYLDSITDFFLMTHANKIWTFSSYRWGSGFSECASVLHKIPLIKVHIDAMGLLL